MTNKEVISAQINHIETPKIAYTFSAEPEIENKITQHYGSADWQKKLKYYMSHCLSCDSTLRVQIDDTYAKDAFGSIWRTDRRPFHLEKPGIQEASFKNYKLPPASVFLDPIKRDLEAAAKLIERDKDQFYYISIGWGLFEHAWAMRGFEEVLIDMLEEPEFTTELIEGIGEYFLAMIKECADLKADAFFFGDDWGEQRGVIMGPERWRQFIKPVQKKLYDAAHAQNKFVLSHCCGNISEIYGDLIEIGLDVHESVQPEPAGMSPYILKEKWGDKMGFWGCLGSQSIIPFGKPDEIKQEIKKLCSIMGKGGGFILSPAKPLQTETPAENAIAIVEALIELS